MKMKPEYDEIVNRLSADLMERYTAEIDNCTSTADMFAVIIAGLVFKRLMLDNFRSVLELDMDSSEEIDDIFKEIEICSNDFAAQVSKRVMNSTMN